jgi:hypothetical protein
MSSAGVDSYFFQDLPAAPRASEGSEVSYATRPERYVPSSRNQPRRTPRKSLIVVLPENHTVSADLVSDRLLVHDTNETVDVILACAGQPLGIAPLQRRVRDLQVLLAPAGTSSEDLRELAMSQAAGDIVTLMSGFPASG